MERIFSNINNLWMNRRPNGYSHSSRETLFYRKSITEKALIKQMYSF